MFGISAGEFIVLVAVAAVVLGPERLPDYARQLARLIKGLRTMAQGATSKVREEMGPEFDEIDWRKLDPRQYDPRRIVREALSDVFDPDDPLGLKDDPLGVNDLKDDPLGLKDIKNDPLGLKAEKPVSRGGPAEATANAQRNGASAATASAATASAATASAEPDVPAQTTPSSDVFYDPDAT